MSNPKPAITCGTTAHHAVHHERLVKQDIDSYRHNHHEPCKGPIRLLRLRQVISMTGLGKTKIYELQAEGDFPMRVKITSHSVGWIEEEVQSWLARRVEASPPVGPT